MKFPGSIRRPKLWHPVGVALLQGHRPRSAQRRAGLRGMLAPTSAWDSQPVEWVAKEVTHSRLVGPRQSRRPEPWVAAQLLLPRRRSEA